MIQGVVTLTIREDNTKARGLRLTVEGIGEVEWNKRYGSKNSMYSGNHRFFDSVTYLFGSKSSESELIAIGVYNYDFSCLIPSNVPYSMEGKHGHIRFRVIANLDIPWAFDLDTELIFKVQRHEDLNLFPHLQSPTELEELVFFTFACCSNPLIITLRLPQQGYAFGEAIPISVSLVNESSVKVYSTTLKLERVFHYCVPGQTKEDCEDIDLQLCSGVDIGQRVTFEKLFVIPTNAYPSNDKYCRVFKVIYRFELTVLSESHFKPKLLLPITVGKFGFRDAQTVHPSAPEEDVVPIGTFTSVPASAPAEVREDLDLPPSFNDLVNEGKILLR